MGTLALNADERVDSVSFASDSLVVGLKDGRQISVPIRVVSSASERHKGSSSKVGNLWRWLWYPLARS